MYQQNIPVAHKIEQPVIDFVFNKVSL